MGGVAILLALTARTPAGTVPAATIVMRLSSWGRPPLDQKAHMTRNSIPEEVEVPTSSPVHGEPALGGGVGVGAWAPPAAGASARPGAGHDVVAGRDILGPAGQHDGVNSDEVQHPGGH